MLAQGQHGKDVIEYEGNLYFVPGSVNQQVLRVTDRTYTCPYKRMCNWVDHAAHDGSLVRESPGLIPESSWGMRFSRDGLDFMPAHGGRRAGEGQNVDCGQRTGRAQKLEFFSTVRQTIRYTYANEPGARARQTRSSRPPGRERVELILDLAAQQRLRSLLATLLTAGAGVSIR